MNKEQAKATLLFRGESLYEFTARVLTDETAIDSDEFVIEGKTIALSEFHMLFFFEFQQIRLLQFISSLFSVYRCIAAIVVLYVFLVINAISMNRLMNWITDKQR